MKKLGKFRAKHSKDITSSRIGIGFECLDREMWNDSPEVYRLAGELGVKYARVQTGWNRCEKIKGKFDFRWLDRIVDKLLEVGIQPWFNLGYGNIHYTECEEQDAVGWAPIHIKESQLAWKKYVANLVKHFKGRITHYEVWNEPDIDNFWNPGSNLDEYMQLLQITVPVIKKNDSNAKIIGGAIGKGLRWVGFAVLEELLKQGMVELIDVYSFHRYHVHPELCKPRDYIALRETLKAYGGQRIELWQGESGCPSRSSTTHALANTPLTEEIQAKVLARSILSDLAADIDYTCYFHMSDFRFYYRNGFCKEPNYFGLISCDEPPHIKLSYYVLQRLCSLFDDNTKIAPRIVINLGVKNQENSTQKYLFQITNITSMAIAFERKERPLIAWWSPANLLPSISQDEPYKNKIIDLYIWTPNDNMKDPIIIDPMTGEIFQPEKCEEAPKMKVNPVLKLKDVPLKDYPMIATERSVVNDMINKDSSPIKMS